MMAKCSTRFDPLVLIMMKVLFRQGDRDLGRFLQEGKERTLALSFHNEEWLILENLWFDFRKE